MKFANETHGKIMQGINEMVLEHLAEHHSKEYNLGWEHAMASAEALVHNTFLDKEKEPAPKPRCVVVLVRRPCPVEDEADETDQHASAPTAKHTDNSINHPDYYNTGKIEVIDFVEDQKLGFHLGNAVKYICRAGKKDPHKNVEDLKKAVWYINRYINLVLDTPDPEVSRHD